MNFSQWVNTVPASITGDALWRTRLYQLALFASDIGWHDVLALSRDKRTLSLADQLYRSLGSIGANIAEGYSYGTGPNRARLYEYALGSARESRHWYYKARYILGEKVTEHRLNLMTSMIRQLLSIIPEQRGRSLKDQPAQYQVDKENPSAIDMSSSLELELLLHDIPFSVTATHSDEE